MKFILRKNWKYACCSIQEGNTIIDLGTVDNTEAKTLLREFEDAVDELKWFINATEVSNDN